MAVLLLCGCVETSLTLGEAQIDEYEKLPITQPYQAVRKYGKTARELGREEGEREGEQNVVRALLTSRFGVLSEQVNQRLEPCTDAELLELAKKILTASSLRELGLEP